MVKTIRSQYQSIKKKERKCVKSCLKGLKTSQVVLVVKNSPANAGDIRDAGSIPELERAPGGHSNSLHILAWRISWTEEPRGQRVGPN